MRHTTYEVSLKNGAKGLFINIPGASVMSFEFNFRAGEYLVDPNKWEVPHLMEHVLLGANELIPKARDFQSELEKNGAYSNATTSVYDINYEAECADFEWDRVLGLMLVAITKPLFLEDEYKAEFGNVQEEMAARSNNHFRQLSLDMRQAFGLITKTDAQRLELMHNVQLSDIRDHYKKTHFAKNLRFVFAGSLTKARQKSILDLLENIDLPEGEARYELPDEMPKKVDSPIFILNETVENLYFYIDTFLGRRLNDSETDALNLTNTILTETLYSRILGTARERGLVYGMNSGLSYTKRSSNWWFGAQVSDKNIKALFDIIIVELTAVMKGKLSNQEISANQQYSLGRFQRSAQTVGGTAAGYTGRYFFDGEIEAYNQIPERIKAITKQNIVDVANLMFADNVWGLGLLGSANEKFIDQLNDQLIPLWPRPSISI